MCHNLFETEKNRINQTNLYLFKYNNFSSLKKYHFTLNHGNKVTKIKGVNEVEKKVKRKSLLRRENKKRGNKKTELKDRHSILFLKIKVYLK